jgi:hypothetical protein
MPQTTLEPLFLHVYNVDSGLWQHKTLGSQVSLVFLEAMNLILRKDGTLAYIGTRSKFGHYLTTLGLETGKGIPLCWTSCPVYITMSKLGLYHNIEIPGSLEIDFYGSPLTVMLGLLLSEDFELIKAVDHLVRVIICNGFSVIDPAVCYRLGLSSPRMIVLNEYHEAESYLHD